MIGAEENLDVPVLLRGPADPIDEINMPDPEADKLLQEQAAQKLIDDFGFTQEQANVIARL